MAEGLDPHTQEVMDENQKLRDQHGVAAERVGEAGAQLAEAQRGLDYAKEQDFRNMGTAATAGGEQAVYVKEAQVAKENERLETHLNMAGMIASENLDMLTEQAKAEMDADLASRQPAEENAEAQK